jgi:hypothetical protein
MHKTIGVYNNKGGVGKTTTASHLAWYAEYQEIPTVAVCIDSQGDLFRILARGNGAMKEGTFYERSPFLSVVFSPMKVPRFTNNVELVIVDCPPAIEVAVTFSPSLWLVPVHGRLGFENMHNVLGELQASAADVLIMMNMSGRGGKRMDLELRKAIAAIPQGQAVRRRRAGGRRDHPHHGLSPAGLGGALRIRDGRGGDDGVDVPERAHPRRVQDEEAEDQCRARLKTKKAGATRTRPRRALPAPGTPAASRPTPRRRSPIAGLIAKPAKANSRKRSTSATSAARPAATSPRDLEAELPSRSKGKRPLKSRHFRLPQEIDEKLEFLADHYDSTLVYVVCKAVQEEWLRVMRQQRRDERTAADVSTDPETEDES